MENNDPEVKEILTRIESRLENIEQSLETIKRSNMKLDEHVDFVDTVFETCKKPFNSLLTMYSGKNVNVDKNKVNYKSIEDI